jgi:hypothetical protein
MILQYKEGIVGLCNDKKDNPLNGRGQMREQLIDINDLAGILKIPAKTIRNKLSDGTWELLPIRIGKALRWPADAYVREPRGKNVGQ